MGAITAQDVTCRDGIPLPKLWDTAPVPHFVYFSIKIVNTKQDYRNLDNQIPSLVMCDNCTKSSPNLSTMINCRSRIPVPHSVSLLYLPPYFLPSFLRVLLPITMSLLLIKEWAETSQHGRWAVEKVEWSRNKKCRRGKEGLCDHFGKGEDRSGRTMFFMPHLFSENPQDVLASLV